MPAKRKTPAQRAPRDRFAERPAGHDEDQEQEPPTPEQPGEPKPAVTPPGGGEAYTPVLPPLGEAISEARQADGELAAEQLTRPSGSLGSVRAHLSKLMAALDKLAARGADG